jgi:acylphosphatase
MKHLHLRITGQVQGVGFRDWLVRKATKLQLSGWVRNAGADTVETVLSGEDDAVDACVQLCRHGPPMAHVNNVHATATTAPGEPGFTKRSSVASHS